MVACLEKDDRARDSRERIGRCRDATGNRGDRRSRPPSRWRDRLADAVLQSEAKNGAGAICQYVTQFSLVAVRLPPLIELPAALTRPVYVVPPTVSEIWSPFSLPDVIAVPLRLPVTF